MRFRSSGGADQGLHIGKTLPLRHQEGARIGGGILALLFGGVFAAFPLLFVDMWLRSTDGVEIQGSSGAAAAVLGVFLLFGLGIMALGVGAFMHRLDLEIDSERVRGSRRGLRGSRIWDDPLSDYRGVLAEEEHHSGSKNRASYTLHKITLKHRRDDGRDALLYRSRSSTGHRAETEAFARLIGRPVIVEGDDGRYSEREVEDLDKSVAELVGEGKLDAAFDPSSPPRSRFLTMQPQGSGYMFETTYLRVGSVVTSALFGVGGLGLMYWYFGPGIEGGEGSPWVVPVVGGVFAAVGVFGCLYSLFGATRLYVQPEGVRLHTTLWQWSLQDRELATVAIEEVQVKKRKDGRTSLRISGDRGQIKFGEYLGDAEREYVRSCVIATISGGGLRLKLWPNPT